MDIQMLIRLIRKTAKGIGGHLFAPNYPVEHVSDGYSFGIQIEWMTSSKE